jgi:hypothetical protein
MKQDKKRKPGRPRVAEADQYTARHVVNLTTAMDDATKKFCAANGVARQSDGIRQLIVKGLKVEGYM